MTSMSQAEPLHVRNMAHNSNALKPRRAKKKSTAPVIAEESIASPSLVVDASSDEDDDDRPLLKRATSLQLINRCKSPPPPPPPPTAPPGRDQNPAPKSNRSFGRRFMEKFAERRLQHQLLEPQKPQKHVSNKIVWPKSVPTASTDEEDLIPPPVEEDPVMAIFRSRNTHRVRFVTPPQKEEESDAVSAPEQRLSPVSFSMKAGSKKDASSQNNGSKNGFQIKQFMKRSLFSGSKTGKGLTQEEEQEVMNEPGFEGMNKSGFVWESSEAEAIHTTTNPPVESEDSAGSSSLVVCFVEDPSTRAAVAKLLAKARRAQQVHCRYEYAVNCYVKALAMLTKAKYPDDHPTYRKAMKSLNSAHHALVSYKNSANIVKLGIRYEESGEMVRALKMYTIAYRIRRDNLGRNHPSLVVLLNMLGSIQIKRGELKEAMQIYQLALQDTPDDDGNGAEDNERERLPPTGNLLARGVTYRDMGTIYEQWGREDEALKMYHRSLECITEWKACVGANVSSPTGVDGRVDADSNDFSLQDLQLTKSSQFNVNEADSEKVDENVEKGEMELFFGQAGKNNNRRPKVPLGPSAYDVYFPPYLDDLNDDKTGREKTLKIAEAPESRHTYADVDLAVTLHQVAQLHRNMGRYPQALEAYHVALRGMKHAMGRLHPNVAAILGNIGNLQKEMGDLDAAYDTYQEVLGIESYRLGLSHPEVTISLHNIATIEAARGNYDHGLAIYRKVLSLQRKLFGEDHSSVAVTAACMGDVYEKLGDVKNAMDSYEEALRIKTVTQGRHHIEVARLLAKLGKMALSKQDLNLADSYVSRAVLIYRLNKLHDNHEWLFDAYRDAADIDAAIAMGHGKNFPC